MPSGKFRKEFESDILSPFHWYSPTDEYALLLSNTEVVIPANHQMDFDNGVLKLSKLGGAFHMPRYHLSLLPEFIIEFAFSWVSGADDIFLFFHR